MNGRGSNTYWAILHLLWLLGLESVKRIGAAIDIETDGDGMED
jgi:hypothetical protein